MNIPCSHNKQQKVYQKMCLLNALISLHKYQYVSWELDLQQKIKTDFVDYRHAHEFSTNIIKNSDQDVLGHTRI